jgi:hypothetical protein
MAATRLLILDMDNTPFDWRAHFAPSSNRWSRLYPI